MVSSHRMAKGIPSPSSHPPSPHARLDALLRQDTFLPATEVIGCLPFTQEEFLGMARQPAFASCFRTLPEKKPGDGAGYSINLHLLNRRFEALAE